MEFSYTTERLYLIAAHPSLAQATTEFYIENRTFLKPFEPERPVDFYTITGQRRELKNSYKMMRKGESVQYWIMTQDRSRVLGTVMLNQLSYGNVQSAFLAYRLGQKETGNGYAREAVAKVMEIAFQDLMLHRVEANIMPRNKASQNLVKALGFKLEGMRASYININGKWEDHFCFSLLNPHEI